MKKIVVAAVLLCSTLTHSVTLVYNLRVRRVFAIAAVLEKMRSRLLTSVVPIYFSRSRPLLDARTQLNGCEDRKAGGAILNFRYVHSKHWWASLTTALATDRATFTGTDPFSASRTGLDDVVLTSGYRHFVGDNMQLIGYGLVGFPTKRDVSLEDRFTPLLGTRFYNIGAGGEMSYSFLREMKQSFATIAQVRWIHGFNRSWCPILPPGGKIQPGDSIDMLFTAQYRRRRTIFEGGYDGTFFVNQALILPTEKIKADTVYRHTVYATFSQAKFKAFFGKPIVYGVGANWSYSPKVDAKTFSIWVHGSIVF